MEKSAMQESSQTHFKCCFAACAAGQGVLLLQTHKQGQINWRSGHASVMPQHEIMHRTKELHYRLLMELLQAHQTEMIRQHEDITCRYCMTHNWWGENQRTYRIFAFIRKLTTAPARRARGTYHTVCGEVKHECLLTAGLSSDITGVGSSTCATQATKRVEATICVHLQGNSYKKKKWKRESANQDMHKWIWRIQALGCLELFLSLEHGWLQTHLLVLPQQWTQGQHWLELSVDKVCMDDKMKPSPIHAQQKELFPPVGFMKPCSRGREASFVNTSRIGRSE